MKTKSISVLFSFFAVFGALALTSANSAFGQSRVYDNLRIAPETPVYDTYDEEPDYNLRLGPFDTTIALGITAEYNDNINLAPDDEALQDWIFRPFLEIESAWRLSDLNTLTLAVGVSYNEYLDNNIYDSESLIISPLSLISFQFFVGDFRITISDSFSYQEDPYELVTLSNEAVYRRYENQFGVQVDWNATQNVIVTAGYTHYNLWAVDEEFESLERVVDTVYIRPSVQITDTVEVGMNASYSWIDYTDSTRGDGNNTLLGAFTDVQLTEYTSLYFEAGYQNITQEGAGGFSDLDEGSVYMKAEISNRLTDNFTHRLTYSRFTEIGLGDEYYKTNNLTYTLNWELFENLTIRPGIFWEQYETTGIEEGNRYGFWIGLGYQLTPSITVDAGYRFLKNDSNVERNEYTQNAFTLTAAYRF